MSFFKDIFGSTDQQGNNLQIEWKNLTTPGQLDDILEESHQKPVVIFKHSTRCGVSRYVLKQFERDFNVGEAVIPYFLDLLQHRDISNAIADQFHIQHQSPQLIVIKDGTALYDASHDSIDAGKLGAFI